MPLHSQSSHALHVAQNLALISLSLALLPLHNLILLYILIRNCLRSPVQERLRYKIRSPRTPYFQPRTILVTGVGMSKGLTLARLFYAAGHDVIGADFEPRLLPICCGRSSKALRAFYRLSKPYGPNAARDYAKSIVEIVKAENVDLWVSCSGVASALEDGLAKESVEMLTTCRAVQFDVATTKKLHEKHSFIDHTKSLGLSTPDTHTITSKEAALEVLHGGSGEGKQYLMKYIGTDDAVRGNMTLLPKDTRTGTKSFLSSLTISESRPWILQQYIQGPEFCTHALIIKGEVKAFVACPSAELLMYYRSLPSESALSQSMLRFTQEYAAAGGTSLTGHLSFDFMVESEEAQAALRDPSINVKLYPIECNPRAHTAVVLFGNTTKMAEAYLSLLDEKLAKPSNQSKAFTNGNAKQPIFPETSERFYWIGHDLVAKCLLPLLSLVLPDGPSFTEVFEHLTDFAAHLLSWTDGTYSVWDPWPAWWLYHVYWPVQFVGAMIMGEKWSRVNVSTCKQFKC